MTTSMHAGNGGGFPPPDLSFLFSHWVIFAFAITPLIIVFIFTITRLWKLYFKSTKRLRTQLSGDLIPILVVFIILAISTAIFIYWAKQVPLASPNLKMLSTGFASSLIEDIVFFTLLGLIILIVQRTEFQRNRKLDDRINNLFSGKDLTSEELTYLKEKVASIACDFREDYTTIDVKKFEAPHRMILIDVMRRFTVGNYLKERPAMHEWEMGITPDELPPDMAARLPSMTIYPSRTTLFDERENGELIKIGVSKALHQMKELPRDGAKHELKPKKEEVRHGQVREYRSRFQGWQTLEKKDGSPDTYNIQILRHWDSMTVDIRNSLSQKIEIKVKLGDQIVAEEELGSGDHKIAVWSDKNVEAGGKLSIEFSVIPN